jgi:hypothetical protein
VEQEIKVFEERDSFRLLHNEPARLKWGEPGFAITLKAYRPPLVMLSGKDNERSSLSLTIQQLQFKIPFMCLGFNTLKSV